MKTSTSRFGSIEFRDDAIISFPTGVIGFPDSNRYVILDHDRDVPFKWLQSVNEPDVAFVVMDPVLFKPDYRVEVEEEDIPELDAHDESDLTMFVLLTIPSGDPAGITANLRGPVVVNHRRRIAKQIILDDDLPTRYPIFSENKAAASHESEPATIAANR
jgi:flagellar assembly factor FliW